MERTVANLLSRFEGAESQDRQGDQLNGAATIKLISRRSKLRSLLPEEEKKKRED